MPKAAHGLTDRERERYLRQIALPGWGEAAQERLAASTVFVAGAGGLGSAATMYLIAGGVGRLRVCDGGRVELSNLNRQILHRERSVGALKVRSARVTLTALDRHARIEPLAAAITAQNVEELVGGADLLVDCLDNFSSRLVLNALAVRAGLPLVHAGARGLGGQLMFIHPPHTPCLVCALGSEGSDPSAVGPSATDPDAADDPAPILGAAAGALGCLQALEALKHLAGIGAAIRGTMLFWDGATMAFESVAVEKDPRCPVCGQAAGNPKERTC
jgi:molybdopterin-synthase adenylyltransferase